MLIEPSPIPGMMNISCNQCGKMYAIKDATGWPKMMAVLEQISLCPDCSDKIDKERQQHIKKLELKKRVDEAIKNAGIPNGYILHKDTGLEMDVPPVPHVGNWLYDRTRCNVLLSGVPGTGKSTGACWCAMRLLRYGCRVRYTTMADLVKDWTRAKRDENDNSTRAMLRNLYGNDLVIVDDVVGKGRNTESTSELVFELLDSIARRQCGRMKLWLLGNFYSGAIEDMIKDANAARRRISENFVTAVVNNEHSISSHTNIWRQLGPKIQTDMPVGQ